MRVVLGSRGGRGEGHVEGAARLDRAEVRSFNRGRGEVSRYPMVMPKEGKGVLSGEDELEGKDKGSKSGLACRPKEGRER